MESTRPVTTPHAGLLGLPQAWSLPEIESLEYVNASSTSLGQSPRPYSGNETIVEASPRNAFRRAAATLYFHTFSVTSANFVAATVAPIHDVQETFLCPVCFENCAVEERRVLADCGRMCHGVCEDCVAQYFKGRIDEARIEEMYCLLGVASGGCTHDALPAVASDAELEDMFKKSPEVYEKYQRFKAQKGDRTIRECPNCCRLCVPELLDKGVLNPEMHCSECSAVFCYYHSWAHREDGNCAAYEARLIREARANQSAFQIQVCPGCQFQTEKDGGCNHMTCQQCKCDWCWICGQEIIGDVGWHYDPKNPQSGCMQFSRAGKHPPPDKVRQRRQIHLLAWRATRCLTCPVRAFTKVLMITSVLISFITLVPVEVCLACCCLGPLELCLAMKNIGRSEEERVTLADVIVTFTGINGMVGLLLGFIVIFAVWIAWIPLALVMFLYCTFIRRIRGCCRIIFMAPFAGMLEAFLSGGTQPVPVLDEG